MQPRVDLRAASQEYWALESGAAVEAFATSPSGLSPDEAARRLKEIGENKIAANHHVAVWRLSLRQYSSPPVLILVFGAFVSLVVKDWADSIIILLIVLGSTMLGFTQEFRTSAAVERLRDR